MTDSKGFYCAFGNPGMSANQTKRRGSSFNALSLDNKNLSRGINWELKH